MKLRELVEKSEGLDKNVLDLIDIKTSEDMKEVLSKFDLLGGKIEHLEKSYERNYSNLKWLIAIIGGVITILLTILALKK